MKKYNIYIAIALFVIGVVIGIWSCRKHYMRVEKDVQRDTTTFSDTSRYAKDEIDTKELPNSKPDTVYIKVPYAVYKDAEDKKEKDEPDNKPDTVYIEKFVYLPVPRQHYFSKVKGVEIYHSGIDSTIDSLNYVTNTTNITNVTQRPKFHKHTITIYGSIGYGNHAVIAPCGAKYLYHPIRWFGVGGKYEHDWFLKTHAILATTEINIGW